MESIEIIVYVSYEQKRQIVQISFYSLIAKSLSRLDNLIALSAREYEVVTELVINFKSDVCHY